MIYPLNKKHWKQIILLTSPMLVLVIAVILASFGIISIPHWITNAFDILFTGIIFIWIVYLIVVNGWPGRKYHIKKQSGLDIPNMLIKYGYTHDVDGKEGWVFYKEKDKPDILANRISIQDQGNQFMVVASKPSGLKKELKEISYMDENYLF